MITARKVHRCDDCGQEIQPGQRYVREVIPPWRDCEGDVDDTGRTIYVLLPPDQRRWHVLKFHLGCGY